MSVKTYVRLNDIAKGAKQNVFGVVSSVVKDFVILNNRNKHGMFNLTDPSCHGSDSRREEILLHIFLNRSDESFPQEPKVGDLFRIRDMEGEIFNDRMNGKIFNSQAVVMFELKEDNDKITPITTNSKYILTDQDEQYVRNLRKWWIQKTEDKENSEGNFECWSQDSILMEKRICDITEPCSFNLFCMVKNVRNVASCNVAVIEVVDGTESLIFTSVVSLIASSQELMSEKNSGRSNGIIISVFEPLLSEALRLKEGDFVQLTHVTCVDTLRTPGEERWCPAFEIYMKGSSSKIVKLKDNSHWPRQIKRLLKENERSSNETTRPTSVQEQSKRESSPHRDGSANEEMSTSLFSQPENIKENDGSPPNGVRPRVGSPAKRMKTGGDTRPNISPLNGVKRRVGSPAKRIESRGDTSLNISPLNGVKRKVGSPAKRIESGGDTSLNTSPLNGVKRRVGSPAKRLESGCSRSPSISPSLLKGSRWGVDTPEVADDLRLGPTPQSPNSTKKNIGDEDLNDDISLLSLSKTTIVDDSQSVTHIQEDSPSIILLESGGSCRDSTGRSFADGRPPTASEAYIREEDLWKFDIRTVCGNYRKASLKELQENHWGGRKTVVSAAVKHIHSVARDSCSSCSHGVCFHSVLWGLCVKCGFSSSTDDLRNSYSERELRESVHVLPCRTCADSSGGDDTTHDTVFPFIKLELCLADWVDPGSGLSVGLSGDGARQFFGMECRFDWATRDGVPVTFQNKVRVLERCARSSPVKLCLLGIPQSNGESSFLVVETRAVLMREV